MTWRRQSCRWVWVDRPPRRAVAWPRMRPGSCRGRTRTSCSRASRTRAPCRPSTRRARCGRVCGQMLDCNWERTWAGSAASERTSGRRGSALEGHAFSVCLHSSATGWLHVSHTLVPPSFHASDLYPTPLCAPPPTPAGPRAPGALRRVLCSGGAGAFHADVPQVLRRGPRLQGRQVGGGVAGVPDHRRARGLGVGPEAADQACEHEIMGTRANS